MFFSDLKFQTLPSGLQRADASAAQFQSVGDMQTQIAMQRATVGFAQPIAPNGLPMQVTQETLKAAGEVTGQHEIWLRIDNMIKQIVRRKTPTMSLFAGHGMVTGQGTGLGTIETSYHKGSDMSMPEPRMEAGVTPDADRQEFERVGTPIPIFRDLVKIDRRQLEASRASRYQNLDVSALQVKLALMMEAHEQLIWNGDGPTYSGNTVKGITQFADRNIFSIGTAWTSSSADIADDVNEMRQLLVNDNFFGPYFMMVPQNWTTTLGRQATGDFRTIMEIINSYGMNDPAGSGKVTVTSSPWLANSNVVMMELSPMVAEVVMPMDIYTTSFYENPQDPGSPLCILLMSALTIQPKSDMDNKCGIVHAS